MTCNLFRVLTALAVAATTVACTAKADVEKVPVGTDVQLTKQDGGVVQGTLTQKDDKAVRVVTGKTTKTTRIVPREEIADVRVIDLVSRIQAEVLNQFRHRHLHEFGLRHCLHRFLKL